MDKGLGRRVHHDSRNLLFPLRASQPGLRRTIYWPIFVKALDQGRTGTCVAHAGVHRLLAAPVVRKQARTIDPFMLYRKVVLNDPWADNDAEATGPVSNMQSGTSTLALMQTLQALGLIDRYEWAYDIERMLDFLCSDGPVIAGTWWHEGMNEPDHVGLLRPTGGRLGGHAYVLQGYDHKRGRIRVLNSWGQWADRGRAWVLPEDFERLLADDGEAVSPREMPE